MNSPKMIYPLIARWLNFPSPTQHAETSLDSKVSIDTLLP